MQILALDHVLESLLRLWSAKQTEMNR